MSSVIIKNLVSSAFSKHPLAIFRCFTRTVAMGRKFIVGGNWKMNGSKAQVCEILEFLKKGPLNSDTEVVVGAPAVYLQFVQENKPGNISVAAQNCYKVAKGAFTGEFSSQMIKENIGYVALTFSNEVGDVVQFFREKAENLN